MAGLLLGPAGLRWRLYLPRIPAMGTG